MGFVSKIWKDRKTEYPSRRQLTKENGSTEIVTVARAEGNISEEGDAFSAANMNNLEQRINDAFEETNSNLNTKIKNVSTGDSNEYIFANKGFWKSGNFQVHIIDDAAIHVCINVDCTKNNTDWIIAFREAYRPYHPFYFDYYLGNTRYRGYINPTDGVVYFETLNTEDRLSCSFCFPIK